MEDLAAASYKLSSQMLEGLAFTSCDLNSLTPEGKEALTALTERHQPVFEEFGIVQLDTYKFQSIFPSKLAEWSQNHSSIKDAYDYIHEKIGKVKITIVMQYPRA